MDSNSVNLQGAAVKHQCTKCNESEKEVEEYQVLLLAITFIGPIIGMLIGLFVGKKILGK